MTEMGGSGTGGKVNIQTADKMEQEINEQNFSKDAFKLAYAITVGLFNDWDANAGDNVGIQISDGLQRPFLFDLGHACPDAFTMDAQTLMPICRGGGSWFIQILKRIVAFLFGVLRFQTGRFFTNPDFMTVEDRADALRDLIEQRDDVLRAIEILEGQFIGDEHAQRMVANMGSVLDGRITYLKRVLEEHKAPMLESNAAID
jgi:hypothetical protein